MGVGSDRRGFATMCGRLKSGQAKSADAFRRGHTSGKDEEARAQGAAAPFLSMIDRGKGDGV